MSLDKAIKHGKEHRKPYTGSEVYFVSCRNHGGCPWCEENRKHKFRDKHPRDWGYPDDFEEVIMKKAMLSQPMAGKTDQEIIETRERAIKALAEKGFDVVNTLFTDEWYSDEKMKERGVFQIPLCFLAKSLENMSLCHAVYFCKGWENARGCRIEHDAAKAYGLEIIYEQ